MLNNAFQKLTGTSWQKLHWNEQKCPSNNILHFLRLLRLKRNVKMN